MLEDRGVTALKSTPTRMSVKASRFDFFFVQPRSTIRAYSSRTDWERYKRLRRETTWYLQEVRCFADLR